jgi:hypothetical protein
VRFFWKRRQRPVPREPDPEALRRAREAAELARQQLAEAESRESEVTQLSDSLERTDRVNNLGPRFWAALGRPNDA